MKAIILSLITAFFFSFGTTKEPVVQNESLPSLDFKNTSFLDFNERATTPDVLLKKWNLNVEGFSPAYYDKANQAFAVNTVEHPTNKWGAATKVWEGNDGIYQMYFTSLCELDGESSYKVKINGIEVLSFTNPLIYNTGSEDYKPFIISVYNIHLKKGSVIQVEFLPHSNELIPENDAFAFARARWRDIEFTAQTTDF